MAARQGNRPAAEYSQLWNCENAFEYKCPREWKSLAPTESESVRFCDECHQNVYMCESPEEFVRNGKQGRCVAVPVEAVPGNVPLLYGWPSKELVRELERQKRMAVSFWEAVILAEPEFSPEGIDEIRTVVQELRGEMEIMDELKPDEGRLE
jgi:hypothetical protein